MMAMVLLVMILVLVWKGVMMTTMIMIVTETQGCYYDNFVITGSITGCHEVVIMTTYGAISDDKLVIMVIVIMWCYSAHYNGHHNV